MDIGESLTNLVFFGNKKPKIQKFEEKKPRSWGKSQALETMITTIQTLSKVGRINVRNEFNFNLVKPKME